MSFPHLTAEGCRERVEKLWQRLPSEIQTVVISHRPHVFYLCGYYPAAGTLRDGAANLLVLKRQADRILVTDNWQAGPAQRAFVDRVEVTEWYLSRTPPRPRKEVTAEALLDLLSPRTGGIGIETLHLSGFLSTRLREIFERDRIVDVSSHLRALRRVKFPDELELLRAAVEVGEVGHHAARNAAVQAATELHVWGVVHSAAVLQAGEPIEMMGDFASGVERSAQGGGPPTLRVLQNGDLFILDLFPLVHGYRCDLTNTLVVGGKPTPQQMAYFDLVRRAMEAAENQLWPGARAADIYQAVWQVFSEAGVSRLFPHHAGHGLGLEHPEAPFFVPESDEILVAGDVVTLEPGLYSRDFGGIRLEHEYLITESGWQRLSHHLTGDP